MDKFRSKYCGTNSWLLDLILSHNFQLLNYARRNCLTLSGTSGLVEKVWSICKPFLVRTVHLLTWNPVFRWFSYESLVRHEPCQWRFDNTATKYICNILCMFYLKLSDSILSSNVQNKEVRLPRSSRSTPYTN